MPRVSNVTYRTRLAGSPPPLLVIQLKRFGSLDTTALEISDATGGLDSCRAKSHKKVVAPSGLDLGRFAHFASLPGAEGEEQRAAGELGRQDLRLDILVRRRARQPPAACARHDRRPLRGPERRCVSRASPPRRRGSAAPLSSLGRLPQRWTQRARAGRPLQGGSRAQSSERSNLHVNRWHHMHAMLCKLADLAWVAI